MLETTGTRKLIRKNRSMIALSSFLSFSPRALSFSPLALSSFLSHLSSSRALSCPPLTSTFFRTYYLFFSPLIFYTFFPYVIYYLLSFLAFPLIYNFLSRFLSLPFSLLIISYSIKNFSFLRYTPFFLVSHIFHSYFINSFIFPLPISPPVYS